MRLRLAACLIRKSCAYADLGASTYTAIHGTGSIGLGDNYTQLYPPVNAKCLTPANNITCYGEFPWVFKDGVRMMFEGGIFTSSATVDACYSLSTMPRCQPNYTDEWIQNQIFTNFSQSTYPMNLVASVTVTNYNAYGTADCGMILWDETNGTANNSTYCGIFDPATSPALPTFGGCGNMDIYEASQTVT